MSRFFISLKYISVPLLIFGTGQPVYFCEARQFELDIQIGFGSQTVCTGA